LDNLGIKKQHVIPSQVMTLKKSICSGENVTNEQRDKQVTPAYNARLIVKVTSAFLSIVILIFCVSKEWV
jgi:hypothetical protein